MKTSTCTLGMPRKTNERPAKVGNYGNWLGSINWDYYCTFTSNYELSVPSARRKMERLYNIIERRGLKLIIFWAAEHFDAKDGCHVHALIKCNRLNADSIKLAWKGINHSKSKFTVIEKFKKDSGANYYVAKHIHRENTEWDILI